MFPFDVGFPAGAWQNKKGKDKDNIFNYNITEDAN